MKPQESVNVSGNALKIKTWKIVLIWKQRKIIIKN